MPTALIYTDGSCLGNPGPGGWAGFIFRNGNESQGEEVSGGYSRTTNNRMELLAVIRSLKVLEEPSLVTLYSDSSYVVNAVTKGWLRNWQKQNFKDRINDDLWRELLPLLGLHKVEFRWVRGHSGDELNELVDQLANKAREVEGLGPDPGYEANRAQARENRSNPKGGNYYGSRRRRN